MNVSLNPDIFFGTTMDRVAVHHREMILNSLMNDGVVLSSSKSEVVKHELNAISEWKEKYYRSICHTKDEAFMLLFEEECDGDLCHFE